MSNSVARYGHLGLGSIWEVMQKIQKTVQDEAPTCSDPDPSKNRNWLAEQFGRLCASVQAVQCNTSYLGLTKKDLPVWRFSSTNAKIGLKCGRNIETFLEPPTNQPKILFYMFYTTLTVTL